MFFSGLFSTHIPYLVLAAVYSISLGIYSVYYINNKIFNRDQPEKEIIISERRGLTTVDLDFRDHSLSRKTCTDFISAISQYLRLEPLSIQNKLIFTPVPGRCYQNPEYKLLSRPPPVS